MLGDKNIGLLWKWNKDRDHESSIVVVGLIEKLVEERQDHYRQPLEYILRSFGIPPEDWKEEP